MILRILSQPSSDVEIRGSVSSSPSRVHFTSASDRLTVTFRSTLCPHCDLTGGTQVGDRTFLGSGARLIPGTRVGDDALVGAGAVVMRTVKDGQRVFGNPARVFTS